MNELRRLRAENKALRARVAVLEAKTTVRHGPGPVVDSVAVQQADLARRTLPTPKPTGFQG